MTIIHMTDEEWTEAYKPIKNHLDDNASCGGEMFETYGEELNFVKLMAELNPTRVWTYADDDNGNPFIQSGYHLVNRIGYFITDNPFDSNHSICVKID